MPITKRYDDLGSINAVKLLPKIDSFNGYIQLYTELDSHIEEGDTIFITYSGDTSNLNATDVILDNYINLIYSTRFIYDPITQGYTVIYVNKNQNTFAINKRLETIPAGKKLYGHFVSKIVCNEINIEKASINSILFKNAEINTTKLDNNISWVQGIVLDGNIYNTTINKKYDTNYISLLLNYYEDTDTYVKYSNLNNNSYDYSYFYNLTSSVKNCIINGGIFYNCSITSDNSGKTISNGYFENCYDITNYNFLDGYLKNSSLNKNNCVWYNGSWDGGTFDLNTWQNGLFLNGIFGVSDSESIWENGNFYNGTWRGTNWNNGVFYGGLFEGTGKTDNNEIIYSVWKNGLFNGGTMYRSNFSTIVWEKGTVNGGKLIDVCFNSGTIKGGEIYNSYIKNCTINGGKILGGTFSNSITSGISYNYITNSNIYSGTLQSYIGNGVIVSDSIIYNGDFDTILFYNNNLFEDGTFKNSTFNNASVFNKGNYDNCNFYKFNTNVNKGTIRKKILLNSSLELIEKMFIDFSYDHIFDSTDAGGTIKLIGFNSQELYLDANRYVSIIANDTYYDPTKYDGTGFSYMNGVGEKYLIIEDDVYKEWMYGDTGIIEANTQNVDPGSMYFNNGKYKNSYFEGEGIIINNGSYVNTEMKNNIVFNNGEFDGSIFYSESGQTENIWYDGKFYSGNFGKYVPSDTYTVVISPDGSEVRTGGTAYSGGTDFKIVDIYPLAMSEVQVIFEGDTPEADFTMASFTNYVNQNQTFIDNSSNSPTSWLWNFGNGDTSTQQNPVYVYTTIGTYTVTLTATNTYGSDTETKIDFITIIDLPNDPVPSFTVSPSNKAYENDTVTFTSTSTNVSSATTYNWDYGDLTTSGPSETYTSITYSYSTSGSYDITLIVTNNGGYVETVTLSGYSVLPAIVIGNAPVADFVGDDLFVFEGDYVNFTDLSTNVPTSWSWTFGDGGFSSSQNPSHRYYTQGRYTVQLTATNSHGSDLETKISYITVSDIIIPPDGRGGLEAFSWTPSYSNPLYDLYPDYIDSRLGQTDNLAKVPFVEEHIKTSDDAKPYDIVVKVECRDTIRKELFVSYLETVQKINFVDLSREIVYDDTGVENPVHEYAYESFRDLFKMDYSLIEYKVAPNNYVYLVFRFNDLYNLYLNASISEKDAYASNWRNLWSMVNSGYYTHPYPTLSTNDITNVKKYNITYWDGLVSSTRTSSWLYGTSVPPWWMQGVNEITFDEAEGETAYKLANPNSETYEISLLKDGEVLTGTPPTPPTENIETLKSLNQAYDYAFYNFQTNFTGQYYMDSTFRNWVKYHIQYRNSIANDGSVVKYWIEGNGVRQNTIKLNNIDESLLLDVYGMPLAYAKHFYEAAYNTLYNKCSNEGILFLNEIPGDWDTQLGSWVNDTFNASSAYGNNRIDANRDYYNTYTFNVHSTWIFEKYHKFKRGDYPTFIESADEGNGWWNWAEFTKFYNQYFYNTTISKSGEFTHLAFDLFTDDEKSDFQHVNSVISTNNVYFNYPAGIEFLCQNIDRDFSDIWSGGTFYNGTFTGKWYGGTWSRGDWKGRNYLNNEVKITPPSNISKDATYKYVENYESLKKRKLYYEVPPWDDANEEREKLIKKTSLKLDRNNYKKKQQ